MAVLAVVGRILLGILIFLLAVILLLLFFPISYEVSGELGEEKKDVTVRVRWLFGFVRFFMTLPKPATPTLKVLWFSILGKKDSDKKKKKPTKKSKQSNGQEPAEDAKPESQSETAQDELDQNQTMQDVTQGEHGSGDAKHPSEVNEEAPGDTETTSELTDATSNASETVSESDKPAQEGHNFGKKKKKEKKSENKKPGTKKPLKEKVGELIEEIKFYKALWEDGNTKPFVQAALAKVLHLLKNLLPRKIRGRILFGAASPDITGYVYGGYTVLRSLYPKRFKAFTFTPDFERKILEGELFVKGWFMLFTVIWDALRILLDKRFKILRKKWKAHKNEKNKSEEGA